MTGAEYHASGGSADAVPPPRRGGRAMTVRAGDGGSPALRPVARAIRPFARARDALDHLVEASPARFAILVFAALVLLFTALLSLPVATTSGRPASLVDALFTAVSAVCVTGLSVVDMPAFWSPFGQTVVVLGAEIGGIGVLTVASILGLVISRRLGLRQRLLAAGEADPVRNRRGALPARQALRLGETGGLLATVAASVLLVELAVAILLFPRILLAGVPPVPAAVQAAYYSIMAFTNTGFLPTREGLAPYATDGWFLGLLMVGVFLGSIGFPVIYTLRRTLRSPRRWSLHVKLTLATSVLLLVLGAAAYLGLESANPRTLGAMDPGQRVLQALFLSTMSRSGGFATIDLAHLHGSSQLVTDMLMFIGGGSASTAGGIKVTTLAVLFLAAAAEARGVDDMEAFGRRIPSDVLRLAVSVALWGATVVAVATIVILQLSRERLDLVLFDVVSAFGTSGLSTGVTARLPASGQYVLAATMFLGRIGTVTLAAALAASQRRRLYRHAEERPIVG